MGTERRGVPSNKSMNPIPSNLNINTDHARALLGQLYSQLESTPKLKTMDGEDIPGFGAFLEALNIASAALEYRAQSLTQDGVELADSLTSSLHAIESSDADGASKFFNL